ncbi:glycerol kinase GlpK [Hominifimenecus sp. rT4P-3]|uniref:glycerol kinase GlpK n=1 Tax=Hominifimenecus sp. rT4P-3 TaxID=3242979 RepID=UPI003DA5CFD5
MEQYIMALDQGTTSSRCILFDRKGNMKSVASREFHQIYPKPGWVEHDPMEIWASQVGVASEAMGKLGVGPSAIAAIGITNQRETTIVWDRETGEPVANAIVWQCRRTAGAIDEFRKTKLAEETPERTGLIPDAYFSASKIQWILDHVPGARKKAEEGRLLFGTVDSWLIWKLTKGAAHVTDRTNASRTMLYDIRKLDWDQELLDWFQIPKSMLPKVQPSSGLFGVTDPTVLGGAIPIAGVAGDQQAALFGQCCFSPGEGKNTYGTGCFLLMNTGRKLVHSKNGLITTIAASADENVEYALEGSVFVGGAAIQWLRDELQLFRKSAESEALAKEAADTAGAYVVPAFTGLGAPYWDPYARGVVVGITRGFNRNHLVRATLESIAYQTGDVLAAMEKDAGISLRSLQVDGGASSNQFLMQFQADILKTMVVRPRCIETTALGAAYLAGLAVGYWKDTKEIRANWEVDCTFQPQMDEAVRKKRLNGWKRAVACARNWAIEGEGNDSDH